MIYTEPGGSTAASMLAQNKDPFPSLYVSRHALPFPSLLEEDNTPSQEDRMEPTNTIQPKRYKQSEFEEK
eukprot:6512991-Ditylum_brightwellii.AAC.1